MVEDYTSEVCKNKKHVPDPATVELISLEYLLIRCKTCGLFAEVTLKWRGNYD